MSNGNDWSVKTTKACIQAWTSPPPPLPPLAPNCATHPRHAPTSNWPYIKWRIAPCYICTPINGVRPAKHNPKQARLHLGGGGGGGGVGAMPPCFSFFVCLSAQRSVMLNDVLLWCWEWFCQSCDECPHPSPPPPPQAWTTWIRVYNIQLQAKRRSLYVFVHTKNGGKGVKEIRLV